MNFYRLKVTSVIDQVAYSNIVALKASGKSDKFFNVSTLVQQEITIQATDNFQYLLSDANGRMLATGKGTAGINRIPVGIIIYK